jgi:hypothetical protein
MKKGWSALGDGMNRKWLSLILVCAIAMFVPSCGHDQSLQSITVTPSGFVFEGVGAQGQFTALGTYIHPPATKDITNQVVWKIDVAHLATITQTGLVTAISVCGRGDVTATSYSNPANPSASNVLVGTATVSGVDDGTPKCMP